MNLMDEIAAPPATEQIRPFSQLVASFGGGQVVQNVTRSVSRMFQTATAATCGKVFLSEVIDPGRQGGRRLSEAERDAGNDTLKGLQITC